MIFFSGCGCILVTFARNPGRSITDSLKLESASLACGLPAIHSHTREKCEFLGLFCPQRSWHSSFRYKSHKSSCLPHGKDPRMVASGLLMGFPWFKGFMAFDMSTKLEENEYSVIQPYNTFTSPRVPSELFTDWEEYSEDSRNKEVSRSALRRYDGAESWVYPMYQLFASSRHSSKSSVGC